MSDPQTHVDGDVVLIHGFWSSPATWDRLTTALTADPQLARVRVHGFGYESPVVPLPWTATRVPSFDDIAQSMPSYLDTKIGPGTPLAFITHSQGGLILQRYLSWMLAEGRGRELARVKLIVMLACPNEGSEYLASIRSILGFGRHPQARDLEVLSRNAADARRIVLRQIVNATTVDARQCPIPVRVYAGRTDPIVTAASAQSAFPFAEVLPGNHFTIHDPTSPGNLTAPTLVRLLAHAFMPQPDTVAPPSRRDSEAAAAATTPSAATELGTRPAPLEPVAAPVPAGAASASAVVTSVYGDAAIDPRPNTGPQDVLTPPQRAIDQARAPRVFISYAHESPEHEGAVEAFWKFLRGNGIDARLDAVAAQLPQDWALWMLREVRDADVVLVIASDAYKRRAEGDADPGEGSGVQWEAALLRDAFYADQASGRLKFVPVVLPGHTLDQIPAWLSPHAATHYRIPDLTLTASEPLIRYLTGQPAITEPSLGQMPQLPPNH